MGSCEELARDLAATLRARAVYLGPKRIMARDAAAPPPSHAWAALEQEALACRRCRLCETRTNVVFGEGDAGADLMFVGEAPGRDEDRLARPFVGRAGQLLTQMIEAMGYRRDEVYIANVLKCRPPENRDPAPDEVGACLPYLMRQIEHIRPRIICALGRHALRSLTGYKGGITKVRGRPMEFLGWSVVPTFHPAYLLRNPAAKREAWEDLKTVLRLLGRPVPARNKKARG
ncbi:MAG: uracil-DNA glycosylase [Planctomycetota bacterium]